MINLFIVLGAFSLLMAVRSFWVAYCVEDYSFRALHYLAMNKLSDSVGAEMSELWPHEYLYWELWHWDFSRYIINQHHYEDMNEWFDKQLTRDNLDYQTFANELAAAKKEEETTTL